MEGKLFRWGLLYAYVYSEMNRNYSKIFLTSNQFKSTYGVYDTEVPIAAPTAPYRGINIIFSRMFITIVIIKFTALFVAFPW